ncbi:MAG: TonB-dependent receptor [Bacteroidia bacterium]|nr:TonB-dependent receptor [Bacteroidia bacterium]
MKSPHLLLVFFLLSFSQLLFAQKSSLELVGKIIDEENQPLKGATVVVLNAADSIMVSFALSNKDGSFKFRRIPVGEYLLQVTFIGYKKISQELNIDQIDQETRDIGTILMEEQDLSLDEVAIEAEQTPILLKKDTVEYNAGSFKVQPNAAVEDLLRKLPGVEVERDGSVKAQGENVQKILVDGKEFFGDDPTIATKNLPADAVDKVQVFDKKSEMAEFSGIDDGERNKTINLKLKDGKKQGAFGKIRGGYGTEDRYEGNFNINRFSKKLQLSALGMFNNTNQQGFSFNDYIQFMGGLGNMMSSGGGGGGGGMSLSINGGGMGIPLGMNQANGFTTTNAGGINFNYDFNKKTEWQSSYFYNEVITDLDRSTNRQNFINDGDFFTEEKQLQESRSKNHRFNFNLKHKIDSSQNLIFRGNIGFNDGSVMNNSERLTLNTERNPENNSLRDNTSEGNQLNLSGTLIYRKRFQKKGRTFSTSLSVSDRDNDQEAFINSINSFFDPNPLFAFVDTVNQSQFQNTKTTNYNLRLNYTEPLSKGLYLGLSASHRNNQYDLIRDVFDFDLRNLDPWVRNEILSNFYDSDYRYNRFGTDLRVNKKKHTMSIGVDGQQSSLKGTPGNTGLPINQEFYALLPKMNWNWDIATAENLSFNYRTNLREPSLEQLQPIVDNSDPLSIYEGNPNLRPEYSHNASLHYMKYDQFSFTSFMVMVNATYTQFKITNARFVDSLFRQITSPVNVDNDLRVTTYLNFSTPIKPLGIKIGLNGNVTAMRSFLFLNEVENLVNRLNSSVGLRIDNRNKDVIDISVGATFGHNLTDYSVSSELNRTFLNQSYNATLILNLGKSWNVETDIDYNIYTDDEFGQQSIPLWRASISRFILKNNRGQLKLSAFDMLQRNLGFSRNSNFNYIEEISTATLSRYFLLSFTYSLSRVGLKSEGQGGGFIMH